jgi:hypothetical protein
MVARVVGDGMAVRAAGKAEVVVGVVEKGMVVTWVEELLEALGDVGMACLCSRRSLKLGQDW